MYTCMICEDESPLLEMEQWKCNTCVFECHKKCIEKWVQSSLHNGGNGNCPYCRSQITTNVYTKEEMFAMFFVLCMSTQPNPVPPHATHFLASDLD